MTPKERAAMQQALEALVVAEEFVNRHSEDWYIPGQQDLKQIREAITALRKALAEQAEQEPVARVTGYYSGRCVIEPLNRATVLPTDMALYAAPVQQVTRADLKAAFKEGFERAADLYAPKDVQEQAEQEPSISDGLCGGCAKKSADGWALYCIECWEKGNGQFASNEPAANAHVSNADSDILSDVKQEPYAYEVWDVQDQSFTMIYATQLKEFHWIEPENIARVLYTAPQPVQEPVAWALTSESGEVLDCISHTYKVTQPCTVDYDEPLYAAPVRTKDLTDDEIRAVLDKHCGDGLMAIAYAVIAADRRKNRA